MIFFGSDNMAPASPEVMAALAAANNGPAVPYGDDPVTQRVIPKIQALFETDCAVYPVTTGTIANGLGLAAFCPAYGAILCHEHSHLIQDEGTGPELITGGARLIPLPGDGARLSAETVDRFLRENPGHGVHHPPHKVLALTQGTELGTVYSTAELRALSATARAHGLKVFMDGARFANAIVATGATAAQMSWQAGIDALSFGATKNGAMAAEALILFDLSAEETLPHNRKRTGHLWSKMRYLSAQIDALLTDELWLKNARHANGMAKQLADELCRLDGVSLAVEAHINELFVSIPETRMAALRGQGHDLLAWPLLGANVYRLVTSWYSQPQQITHLVSMLDS